MDAAMVSSIQRADDELIEAHRALRINISSRWIS